MESGVLMIKRILNVGYVWGGNMIKLWMDILRLRFFLESKIIKYVIRYCSIMFERELSWKFIFESF